MPDTIANNGTAVPDMSRAAVKAIYPNGGRNRTAARMQAALLRGLVGLAAALTAAVLIFLIGSSDTSWSTASPTSNPPSSPGNITARTFR